MPKTHATMPKTDSSVVQRSWDASIFPILSILVLIALMWNYHQSEYDAVFFYWFAGFGCLYNAVYALFFFAFPHCKVTNQYLYLYVNILKIRKIRLSDIKQINEIKDSRYGRGFKLVLYTDKEVDYFPHNRTKKLLSEIKIFFENQFGQACTWK